MSTDSIMFRSPFTTDESLDGSPGIKLKNMQDEQWGPVQVKMVLFADFNFLFQKWFEERFKTQLKVAQGFSLPHVPAETTQQVGFYLNSYDRGSLLALEQMCLAMKSIILRSRLI